MSEFWVNFLANMASDVFLAAAIYLIVTRPGERRSERAMVNQALGLLKAEVKVNADRARGYAQALADPSKGIVALCPLRYTRGAWNALKESGFFSNLRDPHLAYYLFRMNEATLIANRNLRRFQLAYLEDTGGKRPLLAHTARDDSRRVLNAIEKVLEQLENVPLASYPVEDPFELDEMRTIAD
jgi:hypothetical protein